MEVMRPIPADAEEIQSLLYPGYFQESMYSDLDFDPEATRKLILHWIENYSVIIKDDGKIIAFATIVFMKTFFHHVLADVDMFYIHPDYRSTGVSRMLAGSLVGLAKQAEAKKMYASCAVGMGDKNNKLYENLWKKFGFEPVGSVMVGSV